MNSVRLIILTNNSACKLSRVAPWGTFQQRPPLRPANAPAGRPPPPHQFDDSSDCFQVPESNGMTAAETGDHSGSDAMPVMCPRTTVTLKLQTRTRTDSDSESGSHCPRWAALEYHVTAAPDTRGHDRPAQSEFPAEALPVRVGRRRPAHRDGPEQSPRRHGSGPRRPRRRSPGQMPA